MGTEDQGWVAHFALTGLSAGRLTIYGNGKQVRDLLYVDDLIDLMLTACSNIERTAGQVSMSAAARRIQFPYGSSLVSHCSGFSGRLPAVDYGEFRPGDQRIFVTDIRKAQKHLGWMPKVGVAAGLRRMVEDLSQRKCSVDARWEPPADARTAHAPAS